MRTNWKGIIMMTPQEWKERKADNRNAKGLANLTARVVCSGRIFDVSQEIFLGECFIMRKHSS